MVTFKVDNLKMMSENLRAFADFLRAMGIDDDAVFYSRLVSCELITNVIRHSGQAAEFKGELLEDKIAITVTADSLKGFAVRPAVPDVFAEGGRGLYIIKSVCCGDIEDSGGGLRVYIKRSR